MNNVVVYFLLADMALCAARRWLPLAGCIEQNVFVHELHAHPFDGQEAKHRHHMTALDTNRQWLSMAEERVHCFGFEVKMRLFIQIARRMIAPWMICV